MYVNNTIEYIKSGLGLPPDKKQLRLYAAAPAIWALIFGVMLGGFLGGYCLFIGKV